MTLKSTETEIELLKQESKQMAETLDEIKSDIKEIKGFMQAIDQNYVSRKEFELFKKSQNLQKILVGMVTAVITAFVTFEVMRITR